MKIIIGWREWCQLPELNLPAIKAKIDTGARTSALHAFNIQPYTHAGKEWVHFEIHPIQHNDSVIVKCRAQVIDQRSITSSNGMKENRYIISTLVKLGSVEWDIELSLSNRDPLKFRMLLGREALNKHTIIEPSRNYCAGKLSNKKAITLYP